MRPSWLRASTTSSNVPPSEINDLYDSRRRLADQEQLSKDKNHFIDWVWSQPPQKPNQKNLRINDLDLLVHYDLPGLPEMEQLYSHQSSDVRLA